ncbi:uncharacterized protein LOC135485704 [Lineus longissimus]|uniref:uncharacterized protein LOC135485704 n=1 Tax=Lineus longissimus TaxID=88925 RepID=UPI00315DE88F
MLLPIVICSFYARVITVVLFLSSRTHSLEHITKCVDERISIRCPRNERIWIQNAYGCLNCERSCGKRLYKTPDTNSLWDLCNLRDTCDLKVTKHRLDLDYECVPLERIPMYSICTQGEIKMTPFYLHSPGYPKDLSKNRHCECNTELTKPAKFSVTVNQGRFQFADPEIKFGHFVKKIRGPLSVTIPTMFKVVYKNNNESKDHRFWMKLSVDSDEDVTLTCKDVNAMQSAEENLHTIAGPPISTVAGCATASIVLIILVVVVLLVHKKRKGAVTNIVNVERSLANVTDHWNAAFPRVHDDELFPQASPLTSIVTRYLRNVCNNTRKKLVELFATLGVQETQDLLFLDAKDIVPPLKLVEARRFLQQLQDHEHSGGDDDGGIYIETIDDRDPQGDWHEDYSYINPDAGIGRRPPEDGPAGGGAPPLYHNNTRDTSQRAGYQTDNPESSNNQENEYLSMRRT